jgi:CheY-like chemotaxis protein
LPIISGVTIDGDGSVVCLVDLRELSETHAASGSAYRSGSSVAGELTSSIDGVGSLLTVDSDGAGPNHGAGPDVARPRVLVVEDSVGVRELERVILEGAGYQVTTAVDGTEGAAALSGDPVDLVLSDVEMPGIDGYALTRKIRSTPGWEHVPVVIMTSRGSEADQRSGLDAGASAYLLKSEFDQDQLVETVRRLVGR